MKISSPTIWERNFGARVEYERTQVASGRVDLRLKFDGFAVNIEMKVDKTTKPLEDKTAYLKQAAAYQVTDVRIGFLVALRLRAFDPTGGPPSLTELIRHVAFDVPADPVPRHIVLVQVPGNKTAPSASK